MQQRFLTAKNYRSKNSTCLHFHSPVCYVTVIFHFGSWIFSWIVIQSMPWPALYTGTMHMLWGRGSASNWRIPYTGGRSQGCMSNEIIVCTSTNTHTHTHRQLFEVAIQAAIGNRVIARETYVLHLALAYPLTFWDLQTFGWASVASF